MKYKKGQIIVGIWEGLGNQLFQYAFARALQLRTGQSVFLDIESSYKKIYKVPYAIRPCGLFNLRIKLPIFKKSNNSYKYLKLENGLDNLVYKMAQRRLWPYSFFQEKNAYEYNNGLSIIEGNVYLKGHFQNYKYFNEYRDVLQKEIFPKRKIKISKNLSSILRENVISIHFRGRDYVRLNYRLSVSYYCKAMTYIRERVVSPIWLVFTDDEEWVKQNFIMEDNMYFLSQFGNYQDYEELFIMSKCKHNIIANSTFSWWGAWLNSNEEKIVISPSYWWKNIKSSTNIIPSDWIRL